MAKIKNGGLDQCGAERFEQQQFGTAGVEGVNLPPAKCKALMGLAVKGLSNFMIHEQITNLALAEIVSSHPAKSGSGRIYKTRI